ncbi:hypothetical protein Prudu_002854 [Prunus dulcis]|uniref:Uncharacterized protein n=1 Tax=Prunus dulcis TaxID=3755 RepID=A0A4Y1QRP3_PRUDU|nr:hypothetical protein Prudu_002854 [Prunus dulcis]
MAFSSCKLVGGGSLPSAVGENQLPWKRSVTTTPKRALPLQVRSEGKRKIEAPKAFGVSRRDLMLCLPAGTLAAATLFPIKPAEARIVKPEIRRKIQEKFEKIREQFGLSKQRPMMGKSHTHHHHRRRRKASNFAPAPPQNAQGSLLVPPVEAILP